MKNNNEAFETFQEYLSKVNFEGTKTLNTELQSVGHSMPNFTLIYDYLCYLKANSVRFTSLLRQSIL